MIRLIVAYAKHRVIGRKGQMPWHLPNDLKHFKETTTGHTIVMGRKTYESIGKPLPRRRNVVLTANRHFQAPKGVEVIHSPREVAQLGDVFIIGGAQLYEQFLPLADRLYITEIDLETEGDTFFPEWDPQEFRIISQREGVTDPQNPHPHTFYILERKHGK
ncbi:dihydrofolate reductase [Kroppenstedtia eburnea]|uniref:Dihydrofolate reductase n=1 Tax=Kroppenstedtia eburnea TaxID=714067 RepID=A0A1N7KNK0_9BACL|nr:dihydrofolate reductase [Kroppenstedtia eburnea]QKI82891.1 dihydrofolate reductase [Kroppenstedtia eburnea]SIS63066.1 dihydrofolate reductase [Kroppenstedtia eburnea]